MASAVARFARYYNWSYKNRPIRTLACTNGCLAFLGDSIAQRIEMYKDTSQQYNTMRSVKFATYGAGVAPFINIWFRFLNTRFPMPNGGPTYFPQLLKRVAADQLVWAPLGVAVFFGGMGIMDAYSKNLSVMLEVREKFTLYWQVLKTNYMVFPAVQLLTFSVIPLPLRTPFAGFTGMLWVIYLSLVNAKETEGGKS